MLKIINPAWKSAIQLKAEQHAPTVLSWLQAQSTNRFISLSELRAGNPAIAADLTRAVVNQIAEIIGAEMDGEDDVAA